LEAEDGAAALKRLDDHPDIDLLLTDVVMPGGMGGPDLARNARERRPDLKVLFTSGYTEDAIAHGGVLDEGVEMIGKPYQMDELAQKVRRVLDS
ncbi:MAG: response regulator, partial [Proteobacteria bacterium]|nr:response regulator [Pseudomonadota bacterium]